MAQSKNNAAYPTPEQLGDKFFEVLKSWLEPWEMREVAKRNKEETSERVCHSHDFCDANMAMDEAWTSFGLASVDGDNELECKLWGDAWNHTIKRIAEEHKAEIEAATSDGPKISRDSTFVGGRFTIEGEAREGAFRSTRRAYEAPGVSDGRVRLTVRHDWFPQRKKTRLTGSHTAC